MGADIGLQRGERWVWCDENQPVPGDPWVTGEEVLGANGEMAEIRRSSCQQICSFLYPLLSTSFGIVAS